MRPAARAFDRARQAVAADERRDLDARVRPDDVPLEAAAPDGMDGVAVDLVHGVGGRIGILKRSWRPLVSRETPLRCHGRVTRFAGRRWAASETPERPAS